MLPGWTKSFRQLSFSRRLSFGSPYLGEERPSESDQIGNFLKLLSCLLPQLNELPFRYTTCVLIREPQDGRFMAKSQGFIKKFLRRKCGAEGTAATGDVSWLEYAEKAPGSRTVGGKERREEE